ncbi:MAG: UDP-N-acetylmuramoyl-tripeptide--D-alanyl-D-alanine ligase [Bacteroidales bacterium]|nr:UDP-N-acetylmuramoyl-tripeptide--D-alanyl-D-alanine ligase [Candidatus Cacconaster merdequi]
MSVEELYNLYKKCTGVTTDSRAVVDGSMFFALKGDKFDGNDYALQALESGAKYAVVDRVSLGAESFKGHKCIVVENALKTLQMLAAHHRKQFDIPVIGVTGTNGKTTSKELISAVLSKKYRIVATKGNFNNHIGVPLTLLDINEKTQIAVVEMGASAPGEIASLVSIAAPTHGLVTSVGKAHLLGFGSFDGVKKTKGELFDYLRQSGGTAFYNADSEDICEMVGHRKGMGARAYGASLQKACIVPPTLDNPFLTVNLTLDDCPATISTKLVGAYNLDNVLAAVFIGRYFEVPLRKAIAAIEEYVPSNNRSQFVRTEKNVLIVDAYNANPTSMKASLENFSSMDFGGKTLILGDMLELGEDSLQEHKDILSLAVSVCSDIYAVGGEFKAAAGLIAESAAGITCFDNSDSLREYLVGNPLSGRTILIKGSNGMHLQGIKEVL